MEPQPPHAKYKKYKNHSYRHDFKKIDEDYKKGFILTNILHIAPLNLGTLSCTVSFQHFLLLVLIQGKY